jgi:hypothetical protein
LPYDTEDCIGRNWGAGFLPKAAGSQKHTVTGKALRNIKMHSSGDSPFAMSEISLAYAQQDGRAGLRPRRSERNKPRIRGTGR